MYMYVLKFPLALAPIPTVAFTDELLILPSLVGDDREEAECLSLVPVLGGL